MNLRFAPLHLPLERRLQTLAIFSLVHLVAFGGITVIIFSTYALLFTTYFCWFYAAYLCWVIFIDNACETGGRPSKWVKNWTLWKYAADYFPINLIKNEKELDPKKNYLLCYFPHGIIAIGAVISFLTEARNISKLFPNHKVHLHTLRQNFFVPILRELTLGLGAVSSSARSLNYILSKPDGGNLTTLVVGGAQEAFHNKPKHYNLVLKDRKGFVKIALRNGASLVPVMAFGEPDVLDQIEFNEGSIWFKIQVTVKKYLGFVPLVPVGRGIFQYNYGIMPLRKEVNIIVGEPIDTEKVEKPTQVQIDELHGKFIRELIKLFETHKHKYLENCENIHIEII